MAKAKSTKAPQYGAHRVVFELDDVQVRAIRRALVIGLAAYGEVERLCDARCTLDLLKDPYPDSLIPLHVTATNDTIGEFAAALQYLEVSDEAEAANG